MLHRKIRSLPAWLVFCLFVLSCSPLQAVFLVVAVLNVLKTDQFLFSISQLERSRIA